MIDETTMCDACALARIATPATVAGEHRDYGRMDYCQECASQGPIQEWDGWTLVLGDVPAGSPWAEALALGTARGTGSGGRGEGGDPR